MDEKALDADPPQRTAKRQQQNHRHPSLEARESLEAVAGAVIRDADSLEAHNLIMTWDAMAYLGFEGGSVVDGIAGWQGIGKILPLLNARELPRLLWAAAKTRRQATSEGGAVSDGRRRRSRSRDSQPPLWGAEACRLVGSKCEEMKSHQIAVCMWAIVRLGIEPGNGVMHRLASTMLKDTSPGGVRLMNLSWALWAMARCGGGVPEGWMREVADRVNAREGALVRERGGADALVAVPQMLYALALLKGSGEGGVWDGRAFGHEAESLLDAMLLHFEDLAPRMGPQAVTNSLWAIAELGFAPSEVCVHVVSPTQAHKVNDTDRLKHHEQAWRHSTNLAVACLCLRCALAIRSRPQITMAVTGMREFNQTRCDVVRFMDGPIHLHLPLTLAIVFCRS